MSVGNKFALQQSLSLRELRKKCVALEKQRDSIMHQVDALIAERDRLQDRIDDGAYFSMDDC